jgi:hypothetical protein
VKQNVVQIKKQQKQNVAQLRKQPMQNVALPNSLLANQLANE